MVYEPPPDPASWICDALPSRLASESPDAPQVAPERREEPITWDVLRAARDAYPEHFGTAAYL
jgi:hypothetical protein